VADAGATRVYVLMAPVAGRRDSRSPDGGCVEAGYEIVKVRFGCLHKVRTQANLPIFHAAKSFYRNFQGRRPYPGSSLETVDVPRRITILPDSQKYAELTFSWLNSEKNAFLTRFWRRVITSRTASVRQMAGIYEYTHD
jgi:hypothetical protein